MTIGTVNTKKPSPTVPLSTWANRHTVTYPVAGDVDLLQRHGHNGCLQRMRAKGFAFAGGVVGAVKIGFGA